MSIHTPRLTALTLVAVPVLSFSAVGHTISASASQHGGGPSTVTCTNNTAADTAALRAAISGATPNSTLTIAAGTCALSGNLPVHSTMTITGAGAAATFLVQHGNSNIFQITAPGVTVENLHLDTATYNPGPAIPKAPKPSVLFSNQSHTTLRNITAVAGTGFGMRITGPNPCDTYQTVGTVVDNVNITNGGHGGFAALDIDCTNGAQLSNITIHGDYIALFQDENVTLTGENYTPDAKPCQAPWYLTGAANNVTISGVTGGGPGIAKGVVTALVVTNQTRLSGC